MKKTSPIIPVSSNFEPFASVQVTIVNDLPKLYIQCIDAYGYQRELTIQVKIVDGVRIGYSHAYLHPYGRSEKNINPRQARNLIRRFITITQKWPELLFNKKSDSRETATGFVRWHTQLVFGSIPTLRSLNNI